jgi:hypothetical protein
MKVSPKRAVDRSGIIVMAFAFMTDSTLTIIEIRSTLVGRGHVAAAAELGPPASEAAEAVGC